ncbi:MAG: hypothetical protein Q7U98_04825 [Methylicorpusculum sp.]|uniref:hypothetical protein n=1 Tax=Methylicorpusculum sp. TaxID=2713644 RepID=UPI00271A3EA0|nr:hypothetical protein [Methylicorpusculum sp.]MDO8844661.1 hypothetical protein [Methylicorpusculum sp.]MDO8938459.1 hypothetical protein [Methylicorpusculum sp.]MDP2201005.1 hypothetical protein [Methylicorpusculum sp.]
MANNSRLQKIQSGALFQVGTLDLQRETGQKYLIPKLQLGNAYPQAQLYEHLFQNKSDIWDVGLVEKRDRINRDRCGSCITATYRTTVKRGYVDLLEHWRYSSARAYAGKDAWLLIVLLY